VSTAQGFVYVVFIIDVFARHIVGWKVSRSAPRWEAWADSYDNALAETIHGLYKAEMIHRKSW